MAVANAKLGDLLRGREDGFAVLYNIVLPVVTLDQGIPVAALGLERGNAAALVTAVNTSKSLYY